MVLLQELKQTIIGKGWTGFRNICESGSAATWEEQSPYLIKQLEPCSPNPSLLKTAFTDNLCHAHNMLPGVPRESPLRGLPSSPAPHRAVTHLTDSSCPFHLVACSLKQICRERLPAPPPSFTLHADTITYTTYFSP